MHQALLIPEVLLEIFTHVNEILYTPPSTEKSLAALATTCKVFHEPAMDLLWAEIYQLDPLLGCVTRLHPLIYRSGIKWDRSWVEGVEPLSAHEARQFLRHSARVRKLNISSDHPFYLLSVIPAEACVFPRLRSLTLSTTYLDLFLPHMLHQCHLLLTVNESLKSVVTRGTTLEHLCLYLFYTRADNSIADELSLLSDRIRWYTRLNSVTLCCPMLDWAAWQHLSYLPTLLRMIIQPWHTYGDPPSLLEQDIINFSPFLNITALFFEL
ncbi:hypothetical protein F4604DRAFT_1731659, partial [Suillus subluteus]